MGHLLYHSVAVDYSPLPPPFQEAHLHHLTVVGGCLPRATAWRDHQWRDLQWRDLQWRDHQWWSSRWCRMMARDERPPSRCHSPCSPVSWHQLQVCKDGTSPITHQHIIECGEDASHRVTLPFVYMCVSDRMALTCWCNWLALFCLPRLVQLDKDLTEGRGGHK